PRDRAGRPRWHEVLGEVAELGAQVAESSRAASATEPSSAGHADEAPVDVLPEPLPTPTPAGEAPIGDPDATAPAGPPPPGHHPPEGGPPSDPALPADPTGPDPASPADLAPRPEPKPKPEPEPQPTETDAAAEPDGADSDGGRRGGRRLLQDNLIVASGTALSRVTGVARFLAVFGLSASLADVYLLANNTPNIVYELILGGILTATLVPLFTEHLQKQDTESTDAVVSVTLVALAVLTGIGLIVSPLLMLLYTQNADAALDVGQVRRVGIGLALLFVPQIFFYGVMALGSALLNARRRFFAAAWAPVLNNVIVVAILVGAALTTSGELSLAQVDDDRSLLLLLGLGTTAGIVAMAVSLLPALWRAGVRLRFRPSLRHPAVRVAARLSGWTLGYVIANQIAAQTVLWLAFADRGTVRDYQLGFMFFQLPHGLLAVSLMTTFQPDLARAYVARRWQDFHDRLLQGLRLLIAVMVPASVGYLTLATLIVRLGPDATLTAPGGDLEDAVNIARGLAGFAPGLLGFSVYLFVLRAFYAVQDTRRPFWINNGENLTNIAFAVVLAAPFGIIGLTSAYSTAYLAAAVVALLVLLRRLPAGFDLRGLAATLLSCLGSGALMAAAVVAVVAGFVSVDPDLLPLGVAAAVPVGGLAYIAAAIGFGVFDDTGLDRRLPARLRRSP
ncbi:MAG: murein biosynthesis integral membrane protein MurJ, partial [Iamia sp.]